MYKSGRFSREEFNHLRKKHSENQQRKEVWSNWSQYEKPWMKMNEVKLSVTPTPETFLGLRYGHAVDMPQEFIDAIKDPSLEEQCKKAQQLLIHILGDYFNIQKEIQTVYQKITDESIDTSISKTRIVRCIVWKYYGHEPPQQNQWFLNREKNRKMNEKFEEEQKFYQDNHGIERYYTPDSDNPLDQEIVKRVKELNATNTISQEEQICRRILAKQLRIDFRCNTKNRERVDELIDTRIKIRYMKHKKERNEVVREAFCVAFNIKQRVNDPKRDIIEESDIKFSHPKSDTVGR